MPQSVAITSQYFNLDGLAVESINRGNDGLPFPQVTVKGISEEITGFDIVALGPLIEYPIPANPQGPTYSYTTFERDVDISRIKTGTGRSLERIFRLKCTQIFLGSVPETEPEN